MKQIRNLFIYIFLCLQLGCAGQTLIGLNPVKDARIPNRIVWLQIPGLLDEHLAMLRFDYADSRIVTPVEKALCLGKTWQYDLYRLRHSPDLGFLAQMSGSKNLKNSCEDFETLTPFWSYLRSTGPYRVAILERDAQEGLETAWKCEKSQASYKDNVMLFKMSASSKGSSDGEFHFQEKMLFKSGVILNDKSCSSKGCYASLEQNSQAINDFLNKETKSSVFIIRDGRYLEYLKAGNILAAKEVLAEIVKIYESFQLEAQNSNELLLVLSSSGGLGLEMPTQGVSWQQFQKSGRNVLYKRSSLLGVVYADGVQAQNLCGQYEESEILKRILWTPKGGIKNFDFL